jgi:hypothetical protein
LLALIGSAAAAVFWVRRRRPQVGVDVYFEDGSLSSLGEDDPEGIRLLGLAREVRRASS